jgi:hypothetical protein
LETADGLLLAAVTRMRVERLLLQYSDGGCEWRQPATVPDVGEIITRAGQRWIVASIDSDTEDMTVVVLRRAPKAPELTNAQVEVA